MKNLIKKILILIPIGLILFSGSVSAETIGITKMTAATEFEYEFSGLRSSKKMFNFTINGYLAFCLDPELGMRNDLEYVYVGTVDEVFSSQQALEMKKGWLFYTKYKDSQTFSKNNIAKLAAQVFIWTAQKGRYWSSYTYTLAQNVLAAGGNLQAVSLQAGYLALDIQSFYSSLSDDDANAMQLYVWKPKNGANNQRLVTNLKDDGDSVTSEESECKIETWSNLTSCDNNVSNTGNIYQYAYGSACLEQYTGNTPNKKGEATKSYGEYCKLYCLQELIQTYPGNVATAVNVGRYLVWPNNNINNNSYKANANLIEYPMSITLTQRCKLYVDNDTLKTNYATKQNELATAKANAQRNYGINVQTEYVNNTCNNLENVKNEKYNIYLSASATLDEKKQELSVCKNTLLYTTTCSRDGIDTNDVYKSCPDEERAVSYAEQAKALAYSNYELAKNKYDACDAYGKIYEQTKEIIRSFNKCIDAQVENALDFNVMASSSYDDPTYSGSFELEFSSDSKSCQNCNSTISKLADDPISVTNNVLLNKINEVNNRPESEATITKTYDIKDGYYYYVNKKTNESVSTRPSSDYSIIGFSNMPISYESRLGKNYTLNLDVSISGTPFDSQVNSQTYSCYYKVNNVPSNCMCPEDSDRPGMSLDEVIAYKNNNGSSLTCSDAIQTYCYNQTTYYCYYVDGTYYGVDGNVVSEATYQQQCEQPLTCPNDPSMDLKPCINSGKSYNYCYQKYCVTNTEHYKCPAGTTNEGMDLDACVIPLIEKGYNEQYAYNYCVDVSCPYQGIKIIYRTISLQNPFPSYNADKTISQTGLSIGMFNDTVKGRYPGTNWNGTSTVKSKILNNRNVDGDAVYNKEPLYTIILDGQTIKTIRNYNDSQKSRGSYADFTLSCKLNDSSACISSFLRDYNLISSGTCKSATNATSFYTCDN